MGEGEHPIAFASRSLAPEEKNYSQIDKALAIVFGVKHFHQYLFGRSFTIKSNHKPLQHLLGEKNGIPELVLLIEGLEISPVTLPQIKN